MKRILCIALTLLLGLALFAPAVSAAAPAFTQQPKSRVALFAGNSVNLSAAASGATSIEWYKGNPQTDAAAQLIATGATATYLVPLPEVNLYSVDAPSQNFDIYALAKNLDGETVSNRMEVVVIQPFGTVAAQMWENLQWGGGTGDGVWALIQSSLITVPGFLFTYLPGYLFLWILTLIYPA